MICCDSSIDLKRRPISSIDFYSQYQTTPHNLSFGLKNYFSKKHHKNSLDLKLLPNLVHLGHVGDN